MCIYYIWILNHLKILTRYSDLLWPVWGKRLHSRELGLLFPYFCLCLIDCENFHIPFLLESLKCGIRVLLRYCFRLLLPFVLFDSLLMSSCVWVVGLLLPFVRQRCWLRFLKMIVLLNYVTSSHNVVWLSDECFSHFTWWKEFYIYAVVLFLI